MDIQLHADFHEDLPPTVYRGATGVLGSRYSIAIRSYSAQVERMSFR